ncbi:hypothetical protein MKX03_022922 [Papaver bracteatum]|nr:hypothetical protein MKX03_022922 [Papaver bracteatum]
MGHRHLFGTPQLFEMDNDQNPSPLHAEHSLIPLGWTGAADTGGSGFPIENLPAGGINFTSQRRSSNEYSSSSSSTESSHRNIGQRGNEYCSTNITMEIPHHQVTTTGPTYDPILHPTAGGSTWPAPHNYADQPSSSHHRHLSHGFGSSSVTSTICDISGPCKRKRAEVSAVFENGSSSRHYNATNTPDVSLSLDLPSEKPQHWAWDPMSAASTYGGSNLSIGEEHSQRNVRGRIALDLEQDLPQPHLFSNPSRRLPSTGRPVGQNGTVDSTGVSRGATTHEWNYIPVSSVAQGRLIPSDTSGFSHVTNQFSVGSSSSSGSQEICRYNHDQPFRRTPIVPPQTHILPHIQGVRGRSNLAQRTFHAYETASTHPHRGYVPATENAMHSMSDNHSRHLRSLSAVGWRRPDRSERLGLPHPRLHSATGGIDAHARFVEGISMLERSVMYGSRSLLDQHRDMRLDVDNMSYEELLDLGERIGTVNTGLSEDVISKCLIETICCSFDQSQDEGSCAICLEDYKDKEVIGAVKNCGHDYHIGCIRKWLSMKNACPICKSPAVKDE